MVSAKVGVHHESHEDISVHDADEVGKGNRNDDADNPGDYKSCLSTHCYASLSPKNPVGLMASTITMKPKVMTGTRRGTNCTP